MDRDPRKPKIPPLPPAPPPPQQGAGTASRTRIPPPPPPPSGSGSSQPPSRTRIAPPTPSTTDLRSTGAPSNTNLPPPPAAGLSPTDSGSESVPPPPPPLPVKGNSKPMGRKGSDSKTIPPPPPLPMESGSSSPAPPPSTPKRIGRRRSNGGTGIPRLQPGGQEQNSEAGTSGLPTPQPPSARRSSGSGIGQAPETSGPRRSSLSSGNSPTLPSGTGTPATRRTSVPGSGLPVPPVPPSPEISGRRRYSDSSALPQPSPSDANGTRRYSESQPRAALSQWPSEIRRLSASNAGAPPSSPTRGTPTPNESLGSITQLNGATVRRSSIPVGAAGAPSQGVVAVGSAAGSPCAVPSTAPSKAKVKKPPKVKKSKHKANYSILMSGTETESEASSVDSEVVRKVFTDLTEFEEEVFTAVKAGDSEQFFDLVQSESYSFDYNIRNVQGYTILHIAIRRQDEDLVDDILSESGNKIKGFVMRDCLLHAVEEDHMEIVMMLLKNMEGRGIDEKRFPTPPTEPPKDFLAYRRAVIDAEIEYYNSAFDADTTALLLAAHLDSYQLVELFMQRGYRLIAPHTDKDHTKHRPASQCSECRYLDPIARGNRILHYYKAIYKPAYLCYRAYHEDNCDIILEAFHGIEEIRALAKLESEHSMEFKEIEEEIQDFTCSVLQQCRSNDEVKALLRRRSPTNDITERSHYPRLSYAILLDLKDFVSHPHTQQIVYQYWAGEGWPSWRTMGERMLVFHCIARLFIWPFLAIVMLFISPRSKFGGQIAAPVSRCMSSMASYIMFLGFVTVINITPKDVGDRGPPKTGFEWAVVVWTLGHTLTAARQFLQRPKSYLKSAWGYYDLTNLALYYAVFTLWITTFFKHRNQVYIPRKHWPKTEQALIMEILFAFASIMSYGRLLRLFELNYTLGALITAVGKMSRDIGSVLLFFTAGIAAFALGLSRLYLPYTDWKGIDNSTGKPEETTQSNSFITFGYAVETLFWSIFVMGDKANTEIVTTNISSARNHSTVSESHLGFTEFVGTWVYYSFHILSALILMNMMLGLMANTYGHITGDGAGEWIFSTTIIRLSYALDFINPSPLNMIPTPYCMFALFCPKMCQRKAKAKEEDIPYHPLLKTLIQRYFRDKAEITQTQDATSHDAQSLQEQIDELRDAIRSHDMDDDEKPLIKLETDTESEPEFERREVKPISAWEAVLAAKLKPRSSGSKPELMEGKSTDEGDESGNESDVESDAGSQTSRLATPMTPQPSSASAGTQPPRRDSNPRTVHFAENI